MNIQRYIGIPYKPHGRTFHGVDCYGLLYLFYTHEFGIQIPKYSHLDYDEKKADKVILKYGIETDEWKRVERLKVGDVIMFNMLGHPRHIGIFVGETTMLHSLQGHDSVLESFDNIKWNTRIEGFYRHV